MGGVFLKARPNIHLLRVYDKYILYDVDTNSIISVPKNLYGFLQSIRNLSDDEIQKQLETVPMELQQNIKYLEQQGLLHQVNKNMQIKHIETDVLQELFDGNLSMMTLQVTQNCNLRCKYCVYSGSYVNRQHTMKRMSWGTAKAAVDFYYKHTKYVQEVTIGFYGGEPLLELPLIRKVVAYAEEIFVGKKLNFNMTTNATLLTDQAIDFLAVHNFYISISLDGPQKIQDGNRVFADKKSGTFMTVITKIERIKKSHPDFMTNVTFNAVMDLNKDISCANEFFLSYETVKDTFVMGNMINNANRKEDMVVNRKYVADALYEEFKVLLYYCTDILKTYHPTLMDGKVKGIKQLYYDRFVAHNSKTEQDCPGGQCLPGAQRFFVNVDGKFYPCERVDESADTYCIGSLETGFDMERIAALLNVAKLTENECKNCWAFRLCSQCIAVAEEDGKITREKRLSNCAAMRNQIEEDIRDYIVLCDHKCDFNKEVR